MDAAGGHDHNEEEALMKSQTTITDRMAPADAAARILRAYRPDLIVAMKLLDSDNNREAHFRATICVASLDDVLSELQR